MQVSAINAQCENGYNMTNKLVNYNNRFNDYSRDTSFNSLTPYTSKKTVNQWKNFCHQRILGGKLNIIA